MRSGLTVNRYERDTAEESKLLRISIGNRPRVISSQLQCLASCRAVRSRVRRTHGGAVPADYLVHGGSSSAQRNGSRIAEKTRIAQCASELIEDGDSVILNWRFYDATIRLRIGR
jgi:hypothetical protein